MDIGGRRQTLAEQRSARGTLAHSITIDRMLRNHQKLFSRRKFCATVLGFAAGSSRLWAEEDSGASLQEATRAAIENMFNQTAGGKQFWADVWFFHDWRIQRNVLTHRYRLLDGANRRHASGTYAICREKLDEIRGRDRLPPMEGKGVVILHGLFRTRAAMESLRIAIAKTSGYSVFCMGYPTTRGSVSDHAHSLDSVIRSLEELSEINFVAHSLGNLVVRHWLKDLEDHKHSLPPWQKFGRMVMLAPPNHHPKIAASLIRGVLTEFVAGSAAEQLASGWESLQPCLATPHFEFGILAGGKGDGRGFNPLLPGDDDGIVTVESTRLAGARDFRLLPLLHSFFMNDNKVHEYTVQFLRHGYFETDALRQPIEKTSTRE